MRELSLGLAVVIAAVSGVTPALADDELPPIEITYVQGTFVDENGWPIAKIAIGNDGNWDDASVETSAAGVFRIALGSHAVTGPVTLRYSDNEYGQFADGTFRVNAVVPGSVRAAGRIRLKSSPNPGTHRTKVRTSSKAAVRKTYRAGYGKQLRRIERLPRLRGCKLAATSKSIQTRETRALNFVRSLSGLAPVKLDRKLSARAGKAAIIQYHQGYLDHYPNKKAKCYTKAGGAASAETNLSIGMVGPSNVNGYMVDPGYSNREVGHRRWFMDPGLAKFGTAYAGTFNAAHVFSPSNDKAPTPRWLTWPTAGYFPTELEPWGRWSFMTTRSDIDFAKAKVTVKIKGKKQRISLYRAVGGYGSQNGLTWDFARTPEAKGKRTTTATVSVSGMKLRGRTMATVTYKVSLFKAG